MSKPINPSENLYQRIRREWREREAAQTKAATPTLEERLNMRPPTTNGRA